MKIYLVTVLILVCALIFVSGEGGNSNSTSEDDPNASPDSGSNKGSDSDNEHDTNETKPCLCPKIMQRVCGTNGRAYNNICLLLCNNDDVVINYNYNKYFFRKRNSKTFLTISSTIH